MHIASCIRLRALVTAAAFASVLVVTPSAMAQRGGTGTGGGTVFFINGAGGDFVTNYLWTMNADGSNVVQHASWGYFNSPSRTLHGGHRWYLTTLQISGSYYPDGTTLRSEVFALRDDFHPTLNNTSVTKIQLTDDPTLQTAFGWFQGMHWVPGDGAISFKARRWSGSSIAEGGIYTAQLAFGPDGGVTGLAVQPSQPTFSFPLDASGWPAVGSHSWDPTATKVVYTDNPVTGLWVADLSDGSRTQIYRGSTSYPDWSPDGTKIAFPVGASIATVKPNGTQLKVILRATTVNGIYWSAFGHPYFNSSGTHIVCVGVTSANGGANAANDVFRATATGGSLTNLTNTPTLNEIPVAWH